MRVVNKTRDLGNNESDKFSRFFLHFSCILILL